MFEITYGSVNFFLTEETYNELRERIKEEEREKEEEEFFYNQLREVHEECLRTNDPMLWSIYSDLHKDFYGVRP